MKYFWIFLALVVPAIAQTPPCSVSSAANDVQVFVCSGLKVPAADIVNILNMIATRRLDTKAVLAKIGEVPVGSDSALASLTPIQKQNLLALGKMYSGVKVTVVSAKNDPAAAHLAADIASVLNAAGWVKPDGSPLASEEYSGADKLLPGVQVALNDQDSARQRAPNGAIPLLLSLQYMGFLRDELPTGEVQPGDIQIRVATR